MAVGNVGDGRVSPLAYIRFKGVVINGGPGAVVCDLEVVCIAELGGYAGVKGGTVGAARGTPGAVVCVYVMGQVAIASTAPGISLIPLT